MKEPQIIRPFDDSRFGEIAEHVRALRRAVARGNYHDGSEPMGSPKKFNRWFWHNAQPLAPFHEELAAVASRMNGMPMIPSYSLVSMYGGEGICLPHRDRSQCAFTIDLCVDQKERWDLFVEASPYALAVGEALCFWGAEQTHWRPRIQPGNFCDLVLFHFVSASFVGALE